MLQSIKSYFNLSSMRVIVTQSFFNLGIRDFTGLQKCFQVFIVLRQLMTQNINVVTDLNGTVKKLKRRKYQEHRYYFEILD